VYDILTNGVPVAVDRHRRRNAWSGTEPAGGATADRKPGWRQAYLTMGVAYLAVLVPLMWQVTKPTASEAPKPVQQARGANAMSLSPGISVPWLGLAALFCCVAMAIPVVHMVALLADRACRQAWPAD
jgi:hypothetical protein